MRTRSCVAVIALGVLGACSDHSGNSGGDAAVTDGSAADLGGSSPDGGKGPRPGACATAIIPTADTQTARPKGSTCAALGYHEYVPAGYAASSNWPLILSFHGDGERGDGVADLGKLLNAGLPLQIKNGTWDAQKRFVVLSPQMDDRGGLKDRTDASVKAFVDFAVANYDVDVHRVYMTGYSGGAEPIYNYLGPESGGIVAAALPISGWYSTQNQECKWKQVPIWYFHGAVDNTVPAPQHSTLSYTRLVACSPGPTVAPRYTLYKDRAHDDWNLTYDLAGMDAVKYPLVAPGTTPYDVSIYDWFLQYTH